MKLTAGRARLLRGLLERVADGEIGPVIESEAREGLAFLRPAKKRTELKYVAPARGAEPSRTAEVRAACMTRAAGHCECGCGEAFGICEDSPEMDHFFGRLFESAAECWMLKRKHHRAKTENDPSREHWDEKFRAHCARHGYPSPRKRFYRIPMRGRVG